MADLDWKELVIVFFYPQIRRIVETFLGGFGVLAIPVDYILLAIGYWKRKEWWGRGLLYGAVASLGSTMGATIISPFLGGQSKTQSQTQAQEQYIYV